MSGYDAVLLAAQAAGIGLSMYAARQEKKLTEAGIGVEKGEIKLRMEQEQLAFIEANTASLENLGEVLATQRAILGARGQNPGQGSARAAQYQSLSAQSAEKEARKLSHTFRKQQFEGMAKLLNIRRAGASAKYGGTLLETGIGALSLNTALGTFIGDFIKNKPATTTAPRTSGVPTKNVPAYKLTKGLNG